MKLKCILILILHPAFILLFTANNLAAQSSEADNSFYQKALVNTISLYHQSFGSQSALYNGSKYGEYPFRFNGGHPFFNSPEPVAGTVIYDGLMYDSIIMRYDEISDVLVLNAQAARIQLLSERVEYFKLFNSDFIRLVKDSINNNLVSSGFYNLLYKGKISLLKKQIKIVREVIMSNSELQYYADEKDHYYIKKDDSFFPIKRKKDLFKLIGDRKKEVQRFIRGKGLSFRKSRQMMLTEATAYYDNLIK